MDQSSNNSNNNSPFDATSPQPQSVQPQQFFDPSATSTQQPVEQSPLLPIQPVPTPTYIPGPPLPSTDLPWGQPEPQAALPVAQFEPVVAPDLASETVPNPLVPTQPPAWLDQSLPQQSSGIYSEAVPTDLSHLTSYSPQMGDITSSPQIPKPETLVIASPEPGFVPEDNSNSQVIADSAGMKFPKWIFALGGGVLVLVIAASGFFILGVGKQPEVLTDDFSEQAPLTTPPVVLITEEPEPTLSPSPVAEESALEMLRKRQTP